MSLLCAESHERLLRAEFHANTFANACIKFLDNESKSFGIVQKMRGDRNGVIALVPNRSLRTDLPLIVGEFFYQLRAALDGAMWKAYERLGTRLPGKMKEESLYFPFCKAADQLKKAPFNSIPLPPQLKDWIEAIQPCNGANITPGSEDERTAKALWIINRVANMDRHRKPRIVTTIVSGNTATIHCTPPARIANVKNLSASPLEGQYEIAAFEIEGAIAGETEVEVNGNFSLGIMIEDVDNGAISIDALHQLKDAVMNTIQRFDRAIV